ncbi:uncharacterized protein GGS25DRAFT_474745 [Hypoxylon fragiforme]|uniref:uncharacterized protein n=1 Tax=Hypoxylon fragiforme TaxID=63214 RepID=UPI0020C6E414|nr:uncharacterized protein GGS25DRAFT_474745 [Hypoxylon fragiforme]KAI2612302.1 hypothetical protein GGS25DRAFT_474745 [Hypoxylon fragiforme]
MRLATLLSLMVQVFPQWFRCLCTSMLGLCCFVVACHASKIETRVRCILYSSAHVHVQRHCRINLSFPSYLCLGLGYIALEIRASKRIYNLPRPLSSGTAWDVQM